MTRKLLRTVSPKFMWTRSYRNIKTTRHHSSVEIKSTIDNEKCIWGFKVVFSKNREAMKPNESQHSIVERAREKKARNSSIKREREILLDLTWYENRHSKSTTDNRFHHCFKNGLQTDRQTHRQTKYIFSVWQTLIFQSREYYLFSLLFILLRIFSSLSRTLSIWVRMLVNPVVLVIDALVIVIR